MSLGPHKTSCFRCGAKWNRRNRRNRLNRNLKLDDWHIQRSGRKLYRTLSFYISRFHLVLCVRICWYMVSYMHEFWDTSLSEQGRTCPDMHSKYYIYIYILRTYSYIHTKSKVLTAGFLASTEDPPLSALPPNPNGWAPLQLKQMISMIEVELSKFSVHSAYVATW